MYCPSSWPDCCLSATRPTTFLTSYLAILLTRTHLMQHQLMQLSAYSARPWLRYLRLSRTRVYSCLDGNLAPIVFAATATMFRITPAGFVKHGRKLKGMSRPTWAEKNGDERDDTSPVEEEDRLEKGQIDSSASTGILLASWTWLLET